MSNSTQIVINKKSNEYHLASVDASNNIVFDYGTLNKRLRAGSLDDLMLSNAPSFNTNITAGLLDPSTISGLQLWMNMKPANLTVTTAYAVGNAVTAWTDASTNAFSFVPGTAPSYDGFGGIRFTSASSKYLKCASAPDALAPTVAANGGDIFAIIRTNSVALNPGDIFAVGHDNADVYFEFGLSTTAVYFQGLTSAMGGTANSYATATGQIATNRLYAINWRSDGAAYHIYLGSTGTTEWSAEKALQNAGGVNDGKWIKSGDFNTLSLGGYWDSVTGLTDKGDCDLIELLVYNRYLTTTEWGQIRTYFNSKHDLNL